MTCKLTIRRGHNVWLLARTNADAPTPDEVVETTAAFLVKTLGYASPKSERSLFETMQSPLGKRRYYIGAARPVEIEAFGLNTYDPNEPLPGETYARREDCPEQFMAHVEGENVWYVLVDFDWRANAVEVNWPRRRVEWLGFVNSDDEPERPFDWLLLQASHLPEPEHDDSTLSADVATTASKWFGEQVEEVKKGMQKATKAITTVAMFMGGGLLLMGLVYANAKGKK